MTDGRCRLSYALFQARGALSVRRLRNVMHLLSHHTNSISLSRTSQALPSALEHVSSSRMHVSPHALPWLQTLWQSQAHPLGLSHVRFFAMQLSPQAWDPAQFLQQPQAQPGSWWHVSSRAMQLSPHGFPEVHILQHVSWAPARQRPWTSSNAARAAIELRGAMTRSVGMCSHTSRWTLHNVR